MVVIFPRVSKRLQNRPVRNVKAAVVIPFCAKPSRSDPDTDPDGDPAGAMRLRAA